MIEIAAWALVLLAIADWGATVTLVRAALEEQEPALEERATVAVVLTLAATGAAGLAVAFLARIQLGSDFRTFVLIAVLLLISLPQLLWYWAYRVGRFR